MRSFMYHTVVRTIPHPMHVHHPLKHLRLQNHHVLDRAILLPSPRGPNRIHDLHPIHDLPEDRVLPVQMRRRPQRDEKLAAVGVRPAVGHAQHPFRGMRQAGVELVRELAAVDALAASAGARRVPALDHEARDDAVENDVVVLVRRGQGGKVAGRLGYLVFVQGDGDGAVVGREEDARGGGGVDGGGGRGRLGGGLGGLGLGGSEVGVCGCGDGGGGRRGGGGGRGV